MTYTREYVETHLRQIGIREKNMKFSIDRYFGNFMCINNRFYYNFSTDRWLDTKERYHTEVGFKSLIEKLMKNKIE